MGPGPPRGRSLAHPVPPGHLGLPHASPEVPGGGHPSLLQLLPVQDDPVSMIDHSQHVSGLFPGGESIYVNLPVTCRRATPLQERSGGAAGAVMCDMKPRVPVLRISANEAGLWVAHRRVLSFEIPSVPHSVAPLIKWAGGKQWLARVARSLLPRKWSGTYHEPFMGAGAMFFAIQPKTASLSDRCRELVETHATVKAHPEAVIQLLRTLPNDRDFFYDIRAKSPGEPVENAARFLYLNRTCWNGLYRVNKRGEFNTPFGNYKNPTICDEARIRNAAKLLRRARLRAGDFAESTRRVRKEDLVYLDPPYMTRHLNNSFAKYNSHLFRWEDQERLAEEALRLSDHGAYVLVSNVNHPTVLSLYTGFYCYKVRRRTLIGSDPASRGFVLEALLSNYPIFLYPSGVKTWRGNPP